MNESISKPLYDVDVYDDHVSENKAQDIFKNKSIASNCWKFFTRIGVCDNRKKRARYNG